jgi:glycosyltransferase involved in cell wall biosynthesis
MSVEDEAVNCISVVLGTLNRLPYLTAAINSVRQSDLDVPIEIIVVDGGSTDGTLPWLAQQKDIITVIQHNIDVVDGKKVRKRSWGYFMNLGFKISQGELICMISDDSVLHPDALENGLATYRSALERGENIGGIAFRWRSYGDETFYRVGYTLGGTMFVNHGFYVKEALEDVGWIDEDTLKFYFADGDVCLRMAEKGYRVICSEQSFVEHFEHPKRQTANMPNQQINAQWDIYLKRWTGRLYDPNNPEIGDFDYKQGPDTSITESLIPKEIHSLLKKQHSSHGMVNAGRATRNILRLLRGAWPL